MVIIQDELGRFTKISMPQKETLEQQYLVDNLAPCQLAQFYKVSNQMLYRWLIQYNITLKRPYLSNVEMNITSVEKAYFAGYLDGDGTITIGLSKNKRNRKGFGTHFEVSLITKHKDFAIKMRNIIGGNLQTFLYHDSRESKNGYKVSFGNQRSALAFLEQIEPFLILKQQQAKLMITYLRQRLQARQNGNCAVLSEESWKIISEIRRVNNGDKKHSLQKYKV